MLWKQPKSTGETTNAETPNASGGRAEAGCVYERSSEIFKVTAFHNSIRSFFAVERVTGPPPPETFPFSIETIEKKLIPPPKKKIIPKIIPHPYFS